MGKFSKKVKTSLKTIFSTASKTNEAPAPTLDPTANRIVNTSPQVDRSTGTRDDLNEVPEPGTGNPTSGPDEASDPPHTQESGEPSNVGDSANGGQIAHFNGVGETTQPVGHDPQLDDDWRQASNAVWKRAYEQFAKDHQLLSGMYETIIKADVGCSQDLDVKTQMKSIVERQQKHMEERQWTFKLWGSSKSRKVRDTIDGLFSITQSASSLISVGMTLAPVYVSLPWSAISALIPFIMNDTAQQNGAIQGLQDITRIVYSYNIAEKTYLTHGDSERKQTFAGAVLDLYVNILVYQAKVVQYFGQKTLVNFMKNVAQIGVVWANEFSTIAKRDTEAQKNLSFLGPALVADFFRLQTQEYKLLLESLSNQRETDDGILKWLSADSPFDGHFKVKKDLGPRYVTSNQWILKLQEYEDWKASTDGVLWLEGGVGTGKSSITFSIIEDMLRQPSGRVAFFYCSKTTGVDQDQTVTIIRSLLRQCARSVNGASLHSTIRSFHTDNLPKNPDKCELGIEECLEALTEVIGPEEQTSLVIDALDECADLDELLCNLRELWNSSGRKLRILFTSRFGIPVRDYFPAAKGTEVLERNAGDIEEYLRQEIPSTMEGGRLHNAMTDEQASRLRLILKKRAQGMFQWVKLEVGVFLPRDPRARPKAVSDVETNLVALETSTSSLPEMLNNAYKQVYELARGPVDQPYRREMVETALKWVLCSYRPIKLSELAYATAVTSSGTPQADIANNLKVLPEVCSNLLTEDSSGFVRVTHLSVKEYLEQRDSNPEHTGEFEALSCHAQVTLTCLLFKRTSLNSQKESQATSREFSTTFNDASDVGFPSYAVTYWPRHYSHASKNERILASLTAYLMEQVDGPQRLKLLGLTNDNSLWVPTDTEDDRAKLHEKFRHAARLGWENEFEAIIAMGVELLSQNEFGDTALHEAIDWGRTGIVEIILGHAGQNNILSILDAQNDSGNTPLHRAAFWKHMDIIRILRDYKARPDLLNINGMSEASVYALEAKEDGMDDQNPDEEYTKLIFSNNPAYRGQNRRYIYTDPLPISTSTYQGTAEAVVKFEHVKLCKFCDLDLWIKQPSCGFFHGHHKTYIDLETSSSTCALCALLVNEVVRKGYKFKDCLKPGSYISIRSAFSRVPWSSRGSQDLLTVLVGQNAKIDLELFKDRVYSDGVETLSTLSGRPVASNSVAESCFKLAHSWLNDCISNHSTCAKPTSPDLPTRLIHIENLQEGQPRLRLVVAKDEPEPKRGQFVFLSHVWGGTRIPVTTRDNYSDRQEGIPMQEVPSSWQDAIVVLLNLGLNYLWIDAICIVQDDVEDWMNEFPSIGKYIGAATLVLGAGTGSSSQGNLFLSRANKTLETIPYKVQGPNCKLTGLLQVRRPLTKTREAIQKTNLQKRAWAMQEAVLSERLLYYGDEQLYWNCQTCVLSEGSSFREKPMWKLASQLRAISRDPTAISSPVLLNIWYGLVEDFSTKSLTRDSDKLPAIVIIAKAFAANNDAYLAGLWRRDLHRALLWTGTSPEEHEYDEKYIAPSWSWASFHGPVRYELAKGIRLPVDDHSAKVVDAKVQTKQALGGPQVIEAYIKLEGLSQEIRSSLKIASCSYIFDTRRADECWKSGQAYTGVLIAKWSLGWTDVDSRWVGLILAEENDEINRDIDSSPAASIKGGISSLPPNIRKYKRVGLLNGLIYKEEEEMFGWERREFTIV